MKQIVVMMAAVVLVGCGDSGKKTAAEAKAAAEAKEQAARFFQLGFSFGIPVVLSSLYFLAKYLKFKRIHQQMLDTETSAIGSLKPGIVEIQGRVESTLPFIRSPWGRKRCVFYYFHVQELIRSFVGGSGTRSNYKYDRFDRVTDRCSNFFQIRDETGVVDIIPGECEFLIDADFSFTWTKSANVAPEHVEHLKALLKNRYKRKMKLGRSLRLNGVIPTSKPATAWLFNEYVLEEGDAVYVFGEAQQKQGKLVIDGGKTPLIISDKSEAGLEFAFKERAVRNWRYFLGLLVPGLMVSLFFPILILLIKLKII